MLDIRPPLAVAFFMFFCVRRFTFEVFCMLLIDAIADACEYLPNMSGLHVPSVSIVAAVNESHTSISQMSKNSFE